MRFAAGLGSYEGKGGHRYELTWLASCWPWWGRRLSLGGWPLSGARPGNLWTAWVCPAFAPAKD